MSGGRDIGGRWFGDLYALRDVGFDKYGSRLWYCLCRCGNTQTVIASRLMLGRTVTCTPCSHIGRGRVMRSRALDRKYGHVPADLREQADSDPVLENEPEIAKDVDVSDLPSMLNEGWRP